MAAKSWYVIVNPTSGNGSSGKNWSHIAELLNTYDFEFEHVITEYANHSTKLVQSAINQGFKKIISVGGDGTLHNIVNGIMSQSTVDSKDITVGIIPIGTGNDWVKTHNIPNDIEGAIKIIKNGCIKQQDVGEIKLSDTNKEPVYFINLAGVGFDGYVVSKVGKYKGFGAISYLVGTVMGLFSFKNFEAFTTTNGETIPSKTLMILIGICRYSGGGMQLTATPNPYDGLFDVSIAKNLSKLDVIANVKRLFNGTITQHKKVQNLKTNHISITIEDQPHPFIQADGELIGTGNLSVSLIRKAFSFYCK